MDIKETAIEMQNFALPEYEMIPDVGLYLEQVVRYIAPSMEKLGEESLTISMVSNYVKKKIIESPVKKQYFRDQIAVLIFIAIAKTVLSLDDIQLMLNIQKESYPTKDAYEYFRREFSSTLAYVFLGKEMKTDKEMNEKKTLLRNMVIAVGHKVYLDTYLKSLR